MAAVLASSALIPTAVSAAEDVKEATEINKVVFSYDGGKTFLEMTFEDYRDAYNAGVIKTEGLTLIQGNDGKYYSFEDYRDAYNAFKDTKEALAALEEVDSVDVQEGELDPETGQLVGDKDEQPEDRLNETLIYNFAA